MERELLTWGNLIIWVVSSVLIYFSLTFRLYMIFHHPGKDLRARASLRKRRKPSGVMDRQMD